MTALEHWLSHATRCLAKDATAQVRTEIQEHYDLAREAFLAGGATLEEADRLAVNALGDAKTANRQYRHVLLTSAEARMLREGNWEAQALCSSPWLRRLALAMPLLIVAAAGAFFFTGHATLAQNVLICGLGISPLPAALLLPIYTPSRSRVFRCLKWIAMAGALLLLFGPNAIQWSWLLFASLCPLVLTELTRASIRRKLPINAWPKQLYL